MMAEKSQGLARQGKRISRTHDEPCFILNNKYDENQDTEYLVY